MGEPKTPMRIAGALAGQFINSKLTPLFIVFSLLLGAFAILRTPREEEPQIVVPMLDVFVQMPGASAAEVEQRASIPMERLLREVPGVEYVYSISRPGVSMLVVRFLVATKKKTRSSRRTTSCIRISTGFHREFRNLLLRCVRSTMSRSLP